MGHTRLRLALVAGLFVFGFSFLFAQTTLELGVLGGITNYLGDLQQTHFEVRTVRPAAGGYARLQFGNVVSLRAHALRGALWASDANYSDLMIQKRGMSFSGELREAGLQLELAFMHFGAERIRRAAPYLLLGWNRYEFVPESSADNSTLPVDLPAATFTLRDWSVPFGLGFHFLPHPRVNIGFEVSWRKTFTDELDGYAPVGSANDWYFAGTLQVGYRFGKVEKRRSDALTKS